MRRGFAENTDHTVRAASALLLSLGILMTAENAMSVDKLANRTIEQAEVLSLRALLLHFAFTLDMVGLVWFVQRVHHPLFASVGSKHSSSLHHYLVSSTSPSAGSLRRLRMPWIATHAWAGAST